MTKKPIEGDYICWIDLECTGNEDYDKIIEVGVAITDRNFEVVDTLTRNVLLPTTDDWLLVNMKPVVRDMHTKNGLLDDLNRGFNAVKVQTVDDEVASLIRKYNGSNHMAFAGSGVLHFDRRFIRNEMPKTDKRLSYWALDVGVLRRWLVYFDIKVPQAELHGAKTHRALDDILEHINEAKAYRAAMLESMRR